MRWLARIFLTLFILAGIGGVGAIGIGKLKADMAAVPRLESGDLIFNTSLSRQAPAVIFATASPYSHVGIIRREGDRLTVIEATNPVLERPLQTFISEGYGQRFTILRYPGLNEKKRDDIIAKARGYIGRAYNFVFYLPSKNIYCSQLPFLAFAEAGVTLGEVEPIGNLYVNNPLVRQLFHARWKGHPACQDAGMNASACWEKVMKEPIITPARLAHDARLIPVYSNYGI